MYSLLLPVSEIPSGHKVFKVNGKKEYTLFDSIKLYDENKQVIKNDNVNVKYLIDGSNCINMIPYDTVLRIEFDNIFGLQNFIDDMVYDAEVGK